MVDTEMSVRQINLSSRLEEYGQRKVTDKVLKELSHGDLFDELCDGIENDQLNGENLNLIAKVVNYKKTEVEGYGFLTRILYAVKHFLRPNRYKYRSKAELNQLEKKINALAPTKIEQKPTAKSNIDKSFASRFEEAQSLEGVAKDRAYLKLAKEIISGIPEEYRTNYIEKVIEFTKYYESGDGKDEGLLELSEIFLSFIENGKEDEINAILKEINGDEYLIMYVHRARFILGNQHKIADHQNQDLIIACIRSYNDEHKLSLRFTSHQET